MRNEYPFLKLLLVFFLLLSVAGCSVTGSLKAWWSGPPALDWQGMRVVASSSSNQNSPVSFDVVFIKKEEIGKTLETLSAAKWFAQRVDLSRTYPEGFEVRSWELVPGQTLNLSASDFRVNRAYAIYVYANYLAPGEHRAKIDQLSNGMLLQLEAKGFRVLPNDK